MAEKIGFVGLGIMGKPMARNLLKAGYELTIYDIVGEAVEEVAGDGATPASSSSEVAAATDKIITMLPDSADSEKAILGPGGVLEGSSPGKTIIDMSSIAPLVSQRIAAECARKGVEMLDAPVSGGEPGAINATLAIMVGGKQEIFDQNFDLLKTMGSNVVLTGDVGAGGVTKLANQIIVALNIQAVSEALVFAAKAGADPAKVREALMGGFAASKILEVHAERMLKRTFDPGFRIGLHQKDLNLALTGARALALSLPNTATCQQLMSACVAKGGGGWDHSALVRAIEALAEHELGD